MLFEKYFKELGFNEKETLIFQTLYSIGSNPASVIAKSCSLERTYVYKILLNFCDENLVTQFTKNNIKYFFISDISVVKKYVENKKNAFKKLEDNYQNIEIEMMSFNKLKSSNFPKITIYDGNEGLKNLFDNILENIKIKSLLSIKLFASNILDATGTSNKIVKNYRENFLEELLKSKIHLNTYLGNGISIMENLGRTSDIFGIKDLPASNSSINIFVVANIVYIIIYKDIPISLKIQSEELAFAMHFILEKMQ